jgi:hypothetical protein
VFRSNRSQSSRERTAEERERARQERERRRGGKAAEPVVEDVAAPSQTPPLPDPPTVEEPIVHESAVEEPPPPVEEPPPPVEEPPPAVEAPPPPVEDPVEEPAPAVEEPPARRAATLPPLPPPPPRSNPKLSRRVGRIRAQRASAQRWHRRLGTRLLVLLAIVGVGVAVWLLVRSPNDPPKLPALPRVVKVLVPEGYTRAQIAELAKADGLTGSYLDASAHSPLLRPTHYGAPASTPNLEGFLFPATYDMYVGQPAQRLVDEQLAAFRRNFGGGEVFRAHALGITPYQLLIVASMIEREAAIEHDRPLIAAVIYNRLHQNMPLGIDATIRYALNDFSAPLTEAQLHTDSPYNTRLHTGLPPTPISNPGVASIQAAAHPAHVSYLYYVAGADGCGEQVFSRSYAQFEHDAAAYREAIAKNHGRVPTCRKK